MAGGKCIFVVEKGAKQKNVLLLKLVNLKLYDRQCESNARNCANEKYLLSQLSPPRVSIIST